MLHEIPATDPSRRRLLLGALVALVAQAARPDSSPRVIDVLAKRFEFVPNKLRVEPGETVLLRFTTPDVPMGFHLPDYGLRTDILPARPNEVTLTARAAGSHTFVCDVFCGSGHEDMEGTLVVG